MFPDRLLAEKRDEARSRDAVRFVQRHAAEAAGIPAPRYERRLRIAAIGTNLICERGDE